MGPDFPLLQRHACWVRPGGRGSRGRRREVPNGGNVAASGVIEASQVYRSPDRTERCGSVSQGFGITFAFRSMGISRANASNSSNASWHFSCMATLKRMLPIHQTLPGELFFLSWQGFLRTADNLCRASYLAYVLLLNAGSGSSLHVESNQP